MVNQDRNIFAALLLAAGRGRCDDHRRHPHLFADDARDPPGDRSDAEGTTPFGIHVMVGQHHTVFIADTTVNERPTAEQLADIADPHGAGRAAHGA